MLFNPISTAVVLFFIGAVASKTTDTSTSSGTTSDDDPDTDPVKYPRVAGDPIQGDTTFYSTGMGACGVTSQDSDHIAAIGWNSFDNFPGATDNPNDNPMCGQTLSLTTQAGKTVNVTVVDRCAGCGGAFDVDLSPSAFALIGDPDVGRLHYNNWTLTAKDGTVIDVQWPVLLDTPHTANEPLPKTGKMSGPMPTEISGGGSATATVSATVTPFPGAVDDGDDDDEDAATPSVPSTSSGPAVTPPPKSGKGKGKGKGENNPSGDDSDSAEDRKRALRFARNL